MTHSTFALTESGRKACAEIALRSRRHFDILLLAWEEFLRPDASSVLVGCDEIDDLIENKLVIVRAENGNALSEDFLVPCITKWGLLALRAAGPEAIRRAWIVAESGELRILRKPNATFTENDIRDHKLELLIALGLVVPAKAPTYIIRDSDLAQMLADHTDAVDAAQCELDKAEKACSVARARAEMLWGGGACDEVEGAKVLGVAISEQGSSRKTKSRRFRGKKLKAIPEQLVA